MAVDPKLSWAGVNAAIDGVCTALNSGYVRFYSGTAPANADDSNGTNTLLAECRFGATAFGASSGGTATAAAITSDSSANASGTPTYVRYYKSDGTTCLFQGTAGISLADAILTSESITAGQVVSVDSLTLSGVRE